MIAAVILFAALTVYALFAGADFGAGVWEVNTALQPSAKERALLFAAIGPVWEANHVWLIFVLVALFGAFPVAFAALSRALWLPLGLALLGIVFRGVGFVLRSYDPRPVQKIVRLGGRVRARLDGGAVLSGRVCRRGGLRAI